jgi:hypothetical protein
MINKLNLQVKVTAGNDVFTLDNIDFESSVLVEGSVDGSFFWNMTDLEDSLLVFSELEKSLQGSGKYLIFTAATGIADSGGWDGVNVTNNQISIVWDFNRDESEYHFEFELSQYRREILTLKEKLVDLAIKYTLEPSALIFPETWE